MERRVLIPAYESINNVSECDFTFEYEPRYVDKRFEGYRFIIKNKNYIEAKADDVIDVSLDPFEEQIRTFMSFISILLRLLMVTPVSVSILKRIAVSGW